jgi:hypothetical protein
MHLSQGQGQSQDHPLVSHVATSQRARYIDSGQRNHTYIDYAVDSAGDGSFQSFLAVPLWGWDGYNSDRSDQQMVPFSGVALFRSRKAMIPGADREAIISTVGGDACKGLLQAWMTHHSSLLYSPRKSEYIFSANIAATAGDIAVNESVSPFSPEKYYGNLSNMQGGDTKWDSSNSPFADTGSPLPFNTDKSHKHTRNTALPKSPTGQVSASIQPGNPSSSLATALLASLEGAGRSYTELLSSGGVTDMISSYLDVDWAVTFCVEQTPNTERFDEDFSPYSAPNKERLMLLGGPDGPVEFELDQMGGQLRELFSWLLQQPNFSETNKIGVPILRTSGLSAAHVEPSMEGLLDSGLPELLGMGNGAFAQAVQKGLPAQSCPALGARIDYYAENANTKSSIASSGSRSSREGRKPDISLLVLAGRFWRSLVLDDVLPRLNESASLLELAFDLRATRGATDSIYAVACSFDEKVSLIKAAARREQQAASTFEF